jgi:hypothetical protein
MPPSYFFYWKLPEPWHFMNTSFGWTAFNARLDSKQSGNSASNKEANEKLNGLLNNTAVNHRECKLKTKPKNDHCAMTIPQRPMN